jgi:hypothetical protein
MQYWSYILTAVGILGLWLAGRKSRAGWAVGLGAQSLWIVYAVVSAQWGLHLLGRGLRHRLRSQLDPLGQGQGRTSLTSKKIVAIL